MVREPYMMNTEGRLDRQFKFDKMIADICGEEKVAEFDQLWMDNNFNEEDMKFAAWTCWSDEAWHVYHH